MIPPAPILDVSGSPVERGRRQGETYAKAIAAHAEALLDAWKARGAADPIVYRDRLLRETDFRTAIEAHVPHLMREVEAIADGAGRPRDEIYALQLIDEEWAFSRRVDGAPALQKCSSFAIRDAAGDRTWIGQNMDLGAYTDGTQRLVRHAPYEDRPGAVVFTIAGVLALLGVNDRGVGLCVNSIPQVASAAEGVPVAFVIRRLLEARTAAEAADWCRALPHATNQHYVIADAWSIFSLEASSAGVVDNPLPRADRSLHTNHPLANGDRYPVGEQNSVARLRSLDQRLGDAAPSWETLEDALSAHDDPRHPVSRRRSEESGLINFTTGSMIAVLPAGVGRPHGRVSFGPPCERPYVAFETA